VTDPARTALVVLAGAAEPVLDPWRRRHDPAAVERRIPAHITILFPFVAAHDVGDGLVVRLEALYASAPSFGYDLARIDSFPGVAWLAPEPAGPFASLIERTRVAFPHLPPHGDPTVEPVPHCTVAVAGESRLRDAILDELRAGLWPALPIRCEARAVALLEEGADGTWSTRAELPLGASS
jgi:2'-5' RNA ligase